MEWHPKTQAEEKISVCCPLKSGSIVELHYFRFLLLAGSLDWMGKRSEGKRYNYLCLTIQMAINGEKWKKRGERRLWQKFVKVFRQ